MHGRSRQVRGKFFHQLRRRRGHRGTEPLAEAEVRALDAVDGDPRRQLAERSGQFHCFGHAEQVRRAAQQRRRQWLPGGVETVHGAGRRARLHGVDQQRGVDAAERIDQLEAVVAEHTHIEAVTQPRGERLRHPHADAIVTPRAVADAQHAQPTAQRRSTVSFRKCAEQEMHGS